MAEEAWDTIDFAGVVMRFYNRWWSLSDRGRGLSTDWLGRDGKWSWCEIGEKFLHRSRDIHGYLCLRDGHAGGIGQDTDVCQGRRWRRGIGWRFLWWRRWGRNQGDCLDLADGEVWSDIFHGK